MQNHLQLKGISFFNYQITLSVVKASLFQRFSNLNKHAKENPRALHLKKNGKQKTSAWEDVSHPCQQKSGN